MGNLGRYQDIVTEAKLAGGVDAWIKILEDAAVADRSSASFANGAAVGVLAACLMGGGAVAARNLWARKRDRRDLSDAARRHLRAEIAISAGVRGANDDSSPNGTCSEGND